MKITAITRFKHGGLYAVLQKLGWTQKRLAKESGISPQALGSIINLIVRPTVKQANAIQNALGKAGEYLDVLEEWPATFSGTKKALKYIQTEDIPLDRLIDHPEALQIPYDSVDWTEVDERNERLSSAMAKLTTRERQILFDRFWNDMSLADTGKQFGVSRDRVDQLENKALMKLRRFDAIRQSAPWLYGEPINGLSSRIDRKPSVSEIENQQAKAVKRHPKSGYIIAKTFQGDKRGRPAWGLSNTCPVRAFTVEEWHALGIAQEQLESESGKVQQ